MIQIRKAKPDDASGLLELFRRLDCETKFMLYEPEERTLSLQQQIDRVKEFENASTKAMFVAKDQHCVLGFAVGVAGAVT